MQCGIFTTMLQRKPTRIEIRKEDVEELKEVVRAREAAKKAKGGADQGADADLLGLLDDPREGKTAKQRIGLGKAPKK